MPSKLITLRNTGVVLVAENWTEGQLFAPGVAPAVDEAMRQEARIRGEEVLYPWEAAFDSPNPLENGASFSTSDNKIYVVARSNGDRVVANHVTWDR
jgi:hypothetical protein